MAIVNVNASTGIRYGVIDAREVPFLEEEIFQNGTDLDFEAHKAACVKTIAAAVEACGQRDCEATAADIVENFEWDDYQPDEPSYEYADGKGNKFLMRTLGGAYLIWCVQTSAIVHVKSLCSPCVPNAGDLNSGLTNADEGYECYGVPEEWQGKDE